MEFPTSATSEEVWKENKKCVAAHRNKQRLVVPSLFTFPPTLFPSLFTFPPNPLQILRENPLNPTKLNLQITPRAAIRHLRGSIVSAAGRCLQLLSALASQNPLLVNLCSLRSNFYNFFQIRNERNYRNSTSLSNHSFAAILPGDSVAGVVVANGILNFLNIYNTLLIVRLVLTWFPNSPPAIVSPLSTLCDPYLNIFRGIIPPLGGTLDLSPILAFLVLNAFTSTAAALPAELPSTGMSQEPLSSHAARSNLSSSQEKWMRRLYRSRRMSSSTSSDR